MRTVINKLGELEGAAANAEGLAVIKLGEDLNWQQGVIIAVALCL
jgi:hypothetical protein